jgi:large subunit ribosomal protein L14e
MIAIGQVCMKIAGRDAGKTCVVVDVSDGKVLIDGQTRRRKCNPSHLEPISKTVEIKKGAGHEEVVAALKAIGIEVKAQTGSARKQRRASSAQNAEAPKGAAHP